MKKKLLFSLFLVFGACASQESVETVAVVRLIDPRSIPRLRRRNAILVTSTRDNEGSQVTPSWRRAEYNRHLNRDKKKLKQRLKWVIKQKDTVGFESILHPRIQEDIREFKNVYSKKEVKKAFKECEEEMEFGDFEEESDESGAEDALEEWLMQNNRSFEGGLNEES